MSDYKVLNDLAYEYLRDMIYKSELEFGQIYSETKLARQLDISRTPVRDALNRLAHERFIDILPNRGFMLHMPTQADIDEAGHIRLMTECYCAGVLAADYPGEKARQTVKRSSSACWRTTAPTASASSGMMTWCSTERCWIILVFHP